MKKFINSKWVLIISVIFNFLILVKFAKDHYPKPPSFDSKISYMFNRQTLYDLLPVSSDDIVFIGDSQTQRFPLDEMFHTVAIKNRGIDGDITAGVLNRISEATTGHPKKIFIQVGLNDFALHNINPDSAAKNYELIIDRIKKQSPNSAIIVQGIFPTKNVNANILITYNNLVKSVAIKNKCRFIDLYTPFLNNNGMDVKYDAGDGFHLNGNGYLLWSQIIKPYL
ncbi:MAG: GDSL-like protein [Mucilaginibacter sp.]|nr:GDSL-like protein [Mucilaginibacter sp.]